MIKSHCFLLGYDKISKFFYKRQVDKQIKPLPDNMPILGFSNSAANKDMLSKIWTNQSPKNPLICSSSLGKTWSRQVDYPSLPN